MLAVTPDDWSNIVRDRRRDLGLTQAALAERIGMTRQWVVRFENGYAETATIEHATRLAEVLELEIDIQVPVP
ncbi:helix-turn-helix transcriptional regulator [Ruania alkalisoli]|uniref:Helix-turn-helix transcriptional regulator n=1 Tax=Ruania alkalisoli TaxID=2779775 RepID=A0A7M1SX34_9MICO|nr:helix-turn-helix transcriptional regulator [Ruania alkalisoli]QOR71597.1 helix-turn-helix transcriptional regulator [Ruania alkalisoli]